MDGNRVEILIQNVWITKHD